MRRVSHLGVESLKGVADADGQSPSAQLGTQLNDVRLEQGGTARLAGCGRRVVEPDHETPV